MTNQEVNQREISEKDNSFLVETIKKAETDVGQGFLRPPDLVNAVASLEDEYAMANVEMLGILEDVEGCP